MTPIRFEIFTADTGRPGVTTVYWAWTIRLKATVPLVATSGEAEDAILRAGL